MLEIGENERDRMEFVLDAIRDHKGSDLYKTAYDAEGNTLRTNTKKQNAVHLVGVAKIEIEPNEDVYNMEVIGTHNFAVNGGVIVHNCMDDIRYFCNTIMKNKVGKGISNYTPIFM